MTETHPRVELKRAKHSLTRGLISPDDLPASLVSERGTLVRPGVPPKHVRAGASGPKRFGNNRETNVLTVNGYVFRAVYTFFGHKTKNAYRDGPYAS